ncbi:MAG: hypothetical protein HY453_01190 [Parcubacteria group bacterium]|nr:hypothetical protein [Parcubacteria group bacterium]
MNWILRVAVAGEFFGHGVFAMQGKKEWIEWFYTFGISDARVATQFLFIIGLSDVVFAVLLLIKPWRPAVLWMIFWGFFTALLRPIVGLSIWDFVERWANWGAPLALYWLLWPPVKLNRKKRN